MMTTVTTKILERIESAPIGTFFLSKDFEHSSAIVYYAFKQASKKGLVSRFMRGVYFRTGSEVIPTRTLIHHFAKKYGFECVEGELSALNSLGLSTQVPMNLVYNTNCFTKTLKFRGVTIHFRVIPSMYFWIRGEVLTLVIQSMRALGKNGISEKQRNKLFEWLGEEKATNIAHALSYVPKWMKRFLVDYLAQSSSTTYTATKVKN